MRKLFLYIFLGLLWCNFGYAEHKCLIELDVADGTSKIFDKREPGNVLLRTCINDFVYNSDHCECTKYTSSKDLTIIDTSELVGGEPIDMREYGAYSIEDENDKYFLNILAHNLLDLNTISKREFKKILKYKRKKSGDIQGVKLFCGADPNLIGKEDIEMIGLEFRKSSIFIGYGLEGDTWYDIKGNYKRTSSDIELNYSLVGTDKEDSFDIDRKTLKPGINRQCAIINPSINMIKIFKNIQSILISSNENKL